MVDLKSLSARTHSAGTILSGEQRFDVRCSEGPAIVCDAGASAIDGGSPGCPNVFDVRCLPSFQRSVGSLFILFSPKLDLGAMASRIFRSSAACRSSFVTGVSCDPFVSPLTRAPTADAIRYEPLVWVSMLTWLTALVVALADLACRNTGRMVWPFGLGHHRVSDPARGASSSARVAFGKMSIPAWFAGFVKALACLHRRSALENGFHTFIVIEQKGICHAH